MRLLLSLLPIWKKKDLHSSLTGIPPVAMPSPGSRKSTPALTAAADPEFHTNWYISWEMAPTSIGWWATSWYQWWESIPQLIQPPAGLQRCAGEVCYAIAWRAPRSKNAEAFLNQHIQNHHPITVLVYKVVVYVFVLHFSRERKEFVLRVLSLKMYISYNTNVRKLCPISNKSIKFIKKLVAIINMPPPLQTPDYIQ